METNSLKDMIGKEVTVTDPRGKKKKRATILSVFWRAYQFDSGGEIHENVAYEVKLVDKTIVKNKYHETIEYHRRFETRNIEL